MSRNPNFYYLVKLLVNYKHVESKIPTQTIPRNQATLIDHESEHVRGYKNGYDTTMCEHVFYTRKSKQHNSFGS